MMTRRIAVAPRNTRAASDRRDVHRGADLVRKISIIPRGLALGVTFPRPTDRFSHNRREPLAKTRSRRAAGGCV
jgi:hypothetical protein